MERETINYRGKNYHRYPESDRPQHRNYFYRHDKWNESPVALHRQMYEDVHGSIPPRHVIHHKDGNFLNNTVNNFECIKQGEHLKQHPMSQEERERRSAASKVKNNLIIWQKENPELFKEIVRENGKKSPGLNNWRKDNPELANQTYIEAGRKSVEARRAKRNSLQLNGG